MGTRRGHGVGVVRAGEDLDVAQLKVLDEGVQVGQRSLSCMGSEHDDGLEPGASRVGLVALLDGKGHVTAMTYIVTQGLGHRGDRVAA